MFDPITYQPKDIRVSVLKHKILKENFKWTLKTVGDFAFVIGASVLTGIASSRLAIPLPAELAAVLGSGYLGDKMYDMLLDEQSEYKKERNRKKWDERMAKKYNIPLDEVTRYDKPTTKLLYNALQQSRRGNTAGSKIKQ